MISAVRTSNGTGNNFRLEFSYPNHLKKQRSQKQQALSFGMISSPMTLNSEQQHALMTAAQTAAQQTYSPYSQFPVGAAVLYADGSIVHGTNVENISYGLTNCAERVALQSGQVLGKGQPQAIAVWAKNRPNNGVTPCGACRQVIFEFAKHYGNKELPVLFRNPLDGNIQSVSISELLPYTFDSLN